MLLVVAVALVVIVAAYATYGYENTQKGGTTLVIYTYSSLLGGGCNAQNSSSNLSEALAPFEQKYHVTLELECPAGTLASTLISEKNSPVADLVIGLDEVTTPQAEAAGVLVPYASPALADIPADLVNEVSPDHAVTPYEWGYLGIDYCQGFDNASGGAIAHLNLTELATNSTLARNLIVEDPTVDIVGEEFLLWESQFYSQVLHQDWKPWWSAVAPRMSTVDSWDTGDLEYSCAPGTPQMFVSYLTDAAYATYTGVYGPSGSVNSTASWWGGTAYDWKTIYGVGIVRGTSHLTLDEEFINWFLGGTLQAQLPTLEWEYPANSTVTMSPAAAAAYASALDPSTVHALNDGITPAEIAANLPNWLDEWQTTINDA
jgi:thiamine transport system substrate-binding protein